MMPTWMNRTPEAEAARKAAARQRRQEVGNCIRCGLKQDPKSTQLCTKHLIEQRYRYKPKRQRYKPKP
jgi:hypothetical protein